jgi:hypothetical protein
MGPAVLPGYWNGTARGGSGSRLLVTASGRPDAGPGCVAGGWKTCHVPRRTWLDSKIDVFLEELAASGMHLDRQRAGELITGQVGAVAALMSLTEATARTYLGDEIVLPGAEDADVGGVRDADVVTRKSPAAGVAAGLWW